MRRLDLPVTNGAVMVEVELGEPVYIGRYLQLMPRVNCTQCGRRFWTIPSIDKGTCPKCQGVI